MQCALPRKFRAGTRAPGFPRFRALPARAPAPAPRAALSDALRHTARAALRRANSGFPLRTTRVDLHTQSSRYVTRILAAMSAVLMLRLRDPAEFVMDVLFGGGVHSVGKPKLLPVVTKWVHFHPFLKKKDDIVIAGSRRLIGYRVVVDPVPWDAYRGWPAFRRQFLLAALVCDRDELGFHDHARR